MKIKLILYLALVLSGYCNAALVSSLSSGQREIVSTNFNLKIGRCYGIVLTNLVSNKFLSAAAASGDFSGDAFNKKIPEALQMAEQLPQVKKQDYEPRLLDIAPILFVAVWLHGEKDDIIIPLPPTFERWNAYQPYSEKEILKLLIPEAKKKLKSPKGFN